MKKWILASLFALSAVVVLVIVWLGDLNKMISQSEDGPWFMPPIEVYTQSPQLQLGAEINPEQLSNDLTRSGLRRRSSDQALRTNDFVVDNGNACKERVPQASEYTHLDDTTRCFLIQYEGPTFQWIAIKDSTVVALMEGKTLLPTSTILLKPKLFAQYYNGQPILRKILPLTGYPQMCLSAVLAIEDHRFLEHQGISISGIFRAVFDMIRSGGKIRSGGSTITQQLIKNYYLTSERTLRRKVTEIFMALLLEQRVSKEKIFEAYLNVIYMGQNGPFQVLGFGASSQHYFGKPISQLNTAECALLAGILNSPGLFNPFKKPQNALKRRDKVLNHMLKFNFIDDVEFKKASAQPLPKVNPAQQAPPPAPYYVDAVLKELKKKNINTNEGLKVYTSLNPDAQVLAATSLRDVLDDLDKNHSHLKKVKTSNNPLQGSILVIDINSGGVIALAGGRNYKTSQYNRAIEGHRQVGSVMKPLVYLSALEGLNPDGQPYSPEQLIPDKKFTHKYDGQKWTPQNYTKEYLGDIPMYFALKNSINSATAQLGLNIGLDNIIDLAKRLGIKSELQPVPSLTLGAFELYPLELAQAYLTISRMGLYTPLTIIHKVTRLNGDVIFKDDPKTQQIVAPEKVAQLIGMLKQTINSGTAKWVRRAGFNKIAAGKTGTTSDTKDAWFVGFTPKTLAIVWVGLDDNTPHGLTGASGALPVWHRFMSQWNADSGRLDFNWPDSVRKISIDPRTEYPEQMQTEAFKDEPITELIVQ